MSKEIKLDENKKLDIHEILDDLANYHPRRRGWTWRTPVPRYKMHSFEYQDMAESLKKYVPLPSAKYFDNIDPQGTSSITTEIASGRFEDDVRRMRMAAWHGADHLMVIRTAGQSHFEGLIEGTPQGIGGIPITRKQVRAQRKALDAIEDEVGRPINYHSYVSGIAGPEVAVMFAEEGVNGAHQDPQYNVLYRNINMIRSFVDACESKKVMAWAGIAQIDGAHNANATAREAWKVMPELMVQHAINSIFSHKVGMEKADICLSTVPPTAPPAPSMYLDLPYAVALREFFSDYRMRAQQNTKYMEASTREATVTHVLNLLISKLTSADIQSTITPDEGRNVPWHIYNIEAVDTAKQVFQGLDGFGDMVKLLDDGPLRETAREIKERAVLFFEGIIEAGGYFQAVEDAFFVDSGNYPERNDDGISRKINGGVGDNTVYERDEDYLAPVTAHYGYNNVAQYDETAVDEPAKLIDGSTFEKPEKIIFIDELDENDNVNVRLEENKELRENDLIKPEAEWQGDGIILLTMMIPESKRVAEFAALEIGKKMGLVDCEVINKEVMQAAEGTRIELKGRVPFTIDKSTLTIPEEPKILSDDEIREEVKRQKMVLVAGTVGEDEHSVGLREIIDIKHGGIEKYGMEVHYLGTSVPVEKLVDAAIELNADAILASTIISHDDIHYRNMKRIHELAIEKGIREKVMIMAGGTQVIPEIAVQNGMDAGFGRGSNGANVATALVERRREMEREEG
ncbi:MULTISPECIES: D-ornithine 4,5-aminomutase subunit OraE [Enterococcus]|uniref:Cobalamin-dependent protein n=1 Tax=Candidatus Enterococcus murrayae TaxID=2815321 RepID=A0ABS3HP86_9ENTE|nr:D-ornithine 4,5-aminomutase subunit OraE [Enterococcus sp. MJM16]MBO0454398.1 cobalamin-dependent protein [Enterococcus sp. MJM16]